jgi:predicted nucleic acid-binding protein
METHFEIVALDLVVAEIAVQLRRSHHLCLPDAIIWATAKTQDVLLVTRNTKDFNPEWEGIRVPYKI